MNPAAMKLESGEAAATVNGPAVPTTPMPFQCLIVEDEPGFIAMLEEVVRAEGGEVTACGTAQAAGEALARRTFDLVILDNRLPDGSGYALHALVLERSPSTVAVMVTGVPDLAQAIELTRNGLFDYLTKPLNVRDFTACLRRVKQRLRAVGAAHEGDELVGDSPAMAGVVAALRQAARHPNATVLLLGETGTGKDVAARQLHRWTYGPAAPNRPYVALNCSAVPAEMFEAELFGSAKGAYTGADKRRVGLVEAAEAGTLFLDEISEIPLPQQAKLLRFLESREYRALGTTDVAHFTGRLVAATNRSLAQEVSQGRFRADLLYRLDVLSIQLPPLRARRAELGRLAETLLAQLCGKYGRRRPCLQPADLQRLQEYSFPGNVRELRNLLERSLLRLPEEALWLNLDLAWLPGQETPTEAPSLAAGASSAPQPPPNRVLPPLELQEYQLIRTALHEAGGGIRRAAGRLGLTPQALLRRLQKWPELRQVSPPPR